MGEIFKLCRFLGQGELVSFERPDAYIKIENDVNGWVAFINDNISVEKADTDKFTWCNRMKRVLEEFQ